ncbi:MAG TPA: PRC-barrel domain-containing protein [Gaiellaceae bacterium]|nr:PRC-barrel domain-containing protein [Gaiellaceae bacterium]
MSAVSESEFRTLVSLEAVDRGGKSVGYVETVFKDKDTGRPEWLGVMTGTWRHHHHLVPAADVRKSGANVIVPWTKEQIESAPEYDDPDSPISEGLEREAYRHYGLEPAVG